MRNRIIWAALLVTAVLLPAAPACLAKRHSADSKAGSKAARKAKSSCQTTDTGVKAAPHINDRDPFGMTALHWAVANGKQDLVDTLLANGANPNVKDDEGQTPLLIAAQAGRGDLVQMLLQHHADPTITDEDGMTPLHWASVGGHHDVAAILLTAK